MAEQLDLDEAVAQLLAARAVSLEAGTLIVLPVRLGDDGTGQYREGHLTIPKELRSLGVPAEFLQDAEHRTGLSEFSSALVLSYLLGVTQNMTWDGAKTIVQYLYARAAVAAPADGPPEVSVKVVRIERIDGTIIDGVEVRGLANEETALEILRALTGSDAPSDP